MTAVTGRFVTVLAVVSCLPVPTSQNLSSTLATTLHSFVELQLQIPSAADGFTSPPHATTSLSQNGPTSTASTEVWLCLKAQRLDCLHQPRQQVGDCIQLPRCFCLPHDTMQTFLKAVVLPTTHSCSSGPLISFHDRHWQTREAPVSDLIALRIACLHCGDAGL